jgi:alpha-mannosidase
VLNYFPGGKGDLPPALVTLSDETVQVAAFKKAEDDNDYILRLFNPTGEPRSTEVTLPMLGMKKEITLSKYEIKTFKMNRMMKTSMEVDLLER